ncbi:MAG: hypothetical protein EPN43_04285, partial [Jatrophihabitans sp.]
MSAPASRPPQVVRLLGGAVAVLLALAAVAVAVLVGRGATGTSVEVSGGGTRTVSVTEADMRITPSLITVPAGTRLVLHVTNTDSIAHDLTLQTGPATPLLAPGQSATIEVGPVTRTIDGWCTVPGHRAAGMTMSIEVAGSAPSPSATADATIGAATGPAPGWQPRDPGLPPLTGDRVHTATFTVTDTDTEVAPGV